MPPELTQDVNPAGPSSDPAPQNDVPSPSSGGQDVTPASSSGPQDANDKSTLLDVVQDVVKISDDEDVLALPGDQPDTKPNASSPEAGTPGAKSTDGQPDPTPEELAAYSPKAQERIREVIRQRNELQRKFDEFRPQAEQFTQVQSFMAENRLSGEDFQLLLATGAALRRGDLQTFLQVVTPYIDAAQEALGVKLPKDLQDQVQTGLLPEETARELTRLRSQAAMAQGTVQELTQEQQAYATQARVTAVKTAISDWERGIAAQDPDYGAKQAAVQRYAQALVAEQGVPSSPQAAIDLAKRAYDEVNKTFGSLRPAPRPTRPAPTGGQSSTPAVAEPKSMMEAALLGLQRARAS